MTSGRIVVGYDGSHHSQEALTWAVRAARARGSSLLIAHAGRAHTAVAGFVTLVEPDPSPVVQADLEMVADAARTARRQSPGLEVGTVAVPGPVVPALIELMADADLGVVGCRGLGTFAELLVGSTSSQLAGHVGCPLVVVRTPYYAVGGPETGRVVVGVDSSPGAASALDFAFAEAALRGCGLTAIHAWDPADLHVWAASSEGVEQAVAEAEHKVHCSVGQWVAPWTSSHPRLDVRVRVVRGSAVAALVDASAGADLLVVGARGLGGFRSLLLGSVSQAVLHHAYSPVAVVRPRDGGDAAVA